MAETLDAHTMWVAQQIRRGRIQTSELWGADSGLAMIWAEDGRSAHELMGTCPLARSGLFVIDIDPVYDRVAPDAFGPADPADMRFDNLAAAA